MPLTSAARSAGARKTPRSSGALSRRSARHLVRARGGERSEPAGKRERAARGGDRDCSGNRAQRDWRSSARPWPNRWVRMVEALPGTAMAACMVPSPSCRCEGTAGMSSPGRSPAAPLSLSAVRGGSGELRETGPSPRKTAARPTRRARRRRNRRRPGRRPPWYGGEAQRPRRRTGGTHGARGVRAAPVPGARTGSNPVERGGELNKADMVSRGRAAGPPARRGTIARVSRRRPWRGGRRGDVFPAVSGRRGAPYHCAASFR